MAVTYTKGTETELLNPAELGEQLAAVVRQSLPWLQSLTEATASRPEKTGTWSAKEVMGHLTDSAVNNLARIVRLQIEADPTLPGYEQTSWVTLQHYADREWTKILAVWATLNEHIAWTISHVDKADLANKGTVAGGILTLGFLIEDYIAHMEHHLRALKAWAT
jgi:heme-degrading monooxygenase HmoA